MDINSYRSRVDLQPVQLNRTDSIPSDSIRITRFFIDFDEDGEPYQHAETGQTNQMQFSGEDDMIKQSVKDFSIQNMDPVEVIKKSPHLFINAITSYRNGTNKQTLQNFVYRLVNQILFHTNKLNDDDKYSLAILIQKYLNNDRKKFNTAVGNIFLEHLEDIFHRISEYMHQPANPYSEDETVKQSLSMRQIFYSQIQKTIISISTDVYLQIIQGNNINENKLHGEVKKMKQQHKQRKNPLIQRTLKNLKTQAQLNSYLIKECDLQNSGMTITKKEIIQIKDEFGNVINIIDKSTNPELYNQVCGMKSQPSQPELQREPEPQHMNFIPNHVNPSQQQNVQSMIPRRFDITKIQNEQLPQQIEQDEDDYDDTRAYAGFGVSQIPVITPPSFNHKMFQNLEKEVQNIDKLITQNSETIDGKKLKHKKSRR